MSVRSDLRKSAEILSDLMNDFGPECWGRWSIMDLSDCINTLTACCGLLDIAEMERTEISRRQQQKGSDENDD